MKTSKYEKALHKLSRKAVFTAEQGSRAGIPTRMLSYLCLKGEIERISRGIYKTKDLGFSADFEWEDLALIALSIPNGIICLISALCYYDLTDEIMREFWIAVPHSTSSPQRTNARIVRMRNTTLGQTIVKIGNEKLKIFDRERTVVDAFRYLDKEVALKALKGYLQMSEHSKPDIRKLLKYAKALRVDIIPYIQAFML